MPLIIRDLLVKPPTWFSSFRDLTLYCHVFLRAEIVIESEPRDTDFYWKLIRPKGGMDFIEDFVRPGSQDGVRLDVKSARPRTILTPRIGPDNIHNLIGRIKGASGYL